MAVYAGAILEIGMRDQDTDIRRGPGRFPSTQWSVLLAATDPQAPEYREGIERLLGLYWRPVYMYVRTAWARSNEDAKDLTQEFLSRLAEEGRIGHYDKEKGRFRAYLKGALRHFLLDQDKSEGRRKRGGGRFALSLEDKLPEVPTESADPEKLFDRMWGQAVLDQALAEVREQVQREGRAICWQVFEMYELNPPKSGGLSYPEVGEKFGITEWEVKSHLTYVRLRAKQALRKHVAETVATEEDLYRELNELFE